jgi:hypothetical protein
MLRKSSEMNKDTFRGQESQDQGTSQGYGEPHGMITDPAIAQNDSLQISRTTNLVGLDNSTFKPIKRKSMDDECEIKELKI